MEGLDSAKRLMGVLEKYKYAIGILLIGVVLMLLPGQVSAEDPEPTQPEKTQDHMDQMLEEILSHIQGAGSVKVLLTQQTGEEILYQTDTEEDQNGDSSSMQSQTVIVSDSQRNDTGLVRRRDPPRYLGAVIVCQGGDRPQVRLAIVEAVSCVTGLSANQISVLKMK